MIYQFRRILKMDLMNLFTNPMWWIGTIGLPLFLSLIMGFITSGSYGSIISSYDYYGVTILIFGILNNATVAANCFMENRIVKANMRLCLAPVPSFHIYLTKVIASFCFGAVCLTLTGLALHFFAGVNYGGSNVPFIWLLLLAVNFFACCLGIMMCTLLKNEESVNQLLSNLVALACLLGGSFFSLKGFGHIADIVTNISPVSWITTASFRAIYDNDLALLIYICIALLALSVLFLGISAKCFNREDYL